jgi:opacity protein-like surface antigen
MKGMMKAAVALVAVGMLAAGEAQAQMKVLVGGGLSTPMGAFGETEFDDLTEGYGAGSGFNALAGVELGAPLMPIKLRVDASYNRFGLSDEVVEGEVDANYQVIGGTANAVFALPSPALVQPYLIAGVGMYNAKLTGDDVSSTEEVSETKFGINGGVGVNLALGGLQLFGEARIHNIFMSEVEIDEVTLEASDIRMVPITVGLRF